jgi:hypothetical protein
VSPTEELDPDDRKTLDLVLALRDTGNLHPLIERLRAGEIGPELARDALSLLADYDVELLVQVALDTLISEYVTDPGIAHQTRRETRSEPDAPGPSTPSRPDTPSLPASTHVRAGGGHGG